MDGTTRPLWRVWLAIVSLLAAGCATPFQRARERDTLAAYREYLQNHPDSSSAGEARRRLQELEAVRERLASIRKVRLETGSGIDRGALDHELAPLGWSATSDPGETADAVMQLAARFEEAQYEVVNPTVGVIQCVREAGWVVDCTVRSVDGLVVCRHTVKRPTSQEALRQLFAEMREKYGMTK
jgi:hypothetical protein